MEINFSMIGLDPLLAKMRTIEREIRQKGARAALGKSARLVRTRAKQKAMGVDDATTGRKIADNVVQRVRSRYQRNTGDIMISVGVGTDRGPIPKGNPDEGEKGNTPHWHLIEMGTEQMRAQPFLRPALDESIGEAINIFVTDMDKQLDRLLAKK